MSTKDSPDGFVPLEGLGRSGLFNEEQGRRAANGEASGSSSESSGQQSQIQLCEEEKSSKQQPEYYCGLGNCFRPKWLQVFRNAKFFTFLMCLNCFVEGALVSGFTSVVLSTIERRYRFSSTVAGFIASTFDISVFVSVLFISYFGGKGHKPRWLGVSLIVQGLGAFVFALPQFLFGSYEVGSQSEERFESCDAGVDFSSDCTTTNKFALAFFFIGNVLIGIGAAPLFTVGIAYLDDIVRPKYVSVHIGVFFTFSIVGPALGFGLGGGFLSIYVDPWRSTTLDPSDPGWVGAWWLCFLFSAVFSWLLAIPFFLFPRLLPDSKLVKEERETQMAQKYQDRGVDETDFIGSVKSFPYHLKQVVCTPSWVFITLAISMSLFVVSGITAFAPKYLESQFGLTASTASVVAGAVAIPAGGSGALVGALIIFFSKARPDQVAIFNWVISLAILVPLLTFLVRCPNIELAGVTVPYSDGSLVDSDIDAINSSCTLPCQCNSTVFEPVCGGEITYFSPCRAGCQKNSDDPDNLVFENCTCVAEMQAVQNGFNYTDPASLLFLSNSTVTEGRCDQGCNTLGLYLGVIGVGIFLVFMLYVPDVIVTVRCVADEQRSLALGLQSLVFRALGSIPGPIVFGVIFDSACIYWQYECSRRGNCWVYNNAHLSERALSMALSGTILNFAFSFLAWLAYPRPDSVGLCFKKKGVGSSPGKYSANGHTDLSENVSLHSNDTAVGPSERPIKRVSNRMKSHSSEDILLDAVDGDHHGNHTSTEVGVAESAFHGDSHDLRAVSVERSVTSSPVIVESPAVTRI